jgi:hypothetical protein
MPLIFMPPLLSFTRYFHYFIRRRFRFLFAISFRRRHFRAASIERHFSDALTFSAAIHYSRRFSSIFPAAFRRYYAISRYFRQRRRQAFSSIIILRVLPLPLLPQHSATPLPLFFRCAFSAITPPLLPASHAAAAAAASHAAPSLRAAADAALPITDIDACAVSPYCHYADAAPFY